MKVILQQDVKGQGKKGQLVEVSEGYGRNYLLPRKLAIADTIREKYLAKMHQEVPHEMGILVKKIKEVEERGGGGQRWEVDVEVLVNRASQKPIVIGKGAETVKYVRKCAERELSDVFGVKVVMEIWVRVEPNWMKNERLLVEMGYLGELV